MRELEPGEPGWHERYLVQTIAGSVVGLLANPNLEKDTSAPCGLDPACIRSELRRLCDNDAYWRLAGELDEQRRDGSALSPADVGNVASRLVQVLGGAGLAARDLQSLQALALAPDGLLTPADLPQGSQ